MIYRYVPACALPTTPVQYVAVHPLRWHEHGQPSCGFVEADDLEEAVDELCKVARQGVEDLPLDSSQRIAVLAAIAKVSELL